jgi:hypothetical protein
MLIDTRDNSENVAQRELLKKVLGNVDLTTRVSTFIVNHEETLGPFHLAAMVTAGNGSGPTIAITMWKIAPPEPTDGAVVVAAKAALAQRAPG